MNIKIVGYGISLLGIAGILLSSKKIIDSIPFLAGLDPKYILIPAVIAVGVGVVLVMSGSSHKSKLGKEVPIYKGKEIVGYRVLK